MIGRFHAWIFALLTVCMIPPTVLSMVDGAFSAVLAFMYTILICASLTVALWFFCRGADRTFYAKEGLLCVGFAWINICLVGALPFFLSGEIPNFLDALFETVSGFTTTGASILTNVEGLSRGIMYWRSFSHWLGGMGVLVFLLAIVPVSGKNQGFTLHLMRAESPGPDVGKLVPKIRRTAEILYITYFALTALDYLFLRFGGMSPFDAICTAFGTAGTGGFGIKNDSLAGYSPYVQIVTTVFMFLFGVNFSCYYLLMLGRVSSVLRDEELRMYVGIAVGAILSITICNFSHAVFSSFGESLRHAAFQVTSIMSSTGFSTADFNVWPTFSRCLLVLLMLIGACAGSTGGGFKCARLLLLFKGMFRNVRAVIHPQKIEAIRVNRKVVDEQVLSNTNAYLFAYIAILIGSFLCVSLDAYADSPTTALTAVIACINNIGPGLDAVGPTANFSGFHWASKVILIFDMLAGRLEIFPMLVLLSPKVWFNRK